MSAETDQFTNHETFTPSFSNPGETAEQLHAPRPDEVLRELGDAIVQRALAPDLHVAAEEHIAATGRDHTNEHNPGFFIGNPSVGVEMFADHSYRSVDQRAINDLAETGVVRGAFTASDGERANTSSHATFWSDGKEGVRHGFATAGHFIIETPTRHLDGPVTADKLSGVYAKTANGEIRNILDAGR